MDAPLTVGGIAREAGVGIDTVRYYERIGLMPPPSRSPSGYRQYRRADVERLKFIRQAKRLGFSLEEVARLIRLLDTDGDRAEVRALAEGRLAEIERELAEARRLRDTLATLVDACDGRGTVADCPIVEAVLKTGTQPPSSPED